MVESFQASGGRPARFYPFLPHTYLPSRTPETMSFSEADDTPIPVLAGLCSRLLNAGRSVPICTKIIIAQ